MAERPPSSAHPLPAGWKESFDEGRGRWYFYNSSTKQSQWHHPGFEKKAVWVEKFDQRYQRPYWYNRKTKQSSWTRPLEEGPLKQDSNGSLLSVSSSSSKRKATQRDATTEEDLQNRKDRSESSGKEAISTIESSNRSGEAASVRDVPPLEFRAQRKLSESVEAAMSPVTAAPGRLDERRRVALKAFSLAQSSVSSDRSEDSSTLGSPTSRPPKSPSRKRSLIDSAKVKLEQSHTASSFNTARDRAYQEGGLYSKQKLASMQRSSAEDIKVSAREPQDRRHYSSKVPSNESLVEPTSPVEAPAVRLPVGSHGSEASTSETTQNPFGRRSTRNRGGGAFASMLTPSGNKRSHVILTSRPAFSSLHQRRLGSKSPQNGATRLSPVLDTLLPGKDEATSRSDDGQPLGLSDNSQELQFGGNVKAVTSEAQPNQEQDEELRPASNIHTTGGSHHLGVQVPAMQLTHSSSVLADDRKDGANSDEHIRLEGVSFYQQVEESGDCAAISDGQVVHESDGDAAEEVASRDMTAGGVVGSEQDGSDSEASGDIPDFSDIGSPQGESLAFEHAQAAALRFGSSGDEQVMDGRQFSVNTVSVNLIQTQMEIEYNQGATRPVSAPLDDDIEPPADEYDIEPPPGHEDGLSDSSGDSGSNQGQIDAQESISRSDEVGVHGSQFAVVEEEGADMSDSDMASGHTNPEYPAADIGEECAVPHEDGIEHEIEEMIVDREGQEEDNYDELGDGQALEENVQPRGPDDEPFLYNDDERIMDESDQGAIHNGDASLHESAESVVETPEHGNGVELQPEQAGATMEDGMEGRGSELAGHEKGDSEGTESDGNALSQEVLANNSQVDYIQNDELGSPQLEGDQMTTDVREAWDLDDFELVNDEHQNQLDVLDRAAEEQEASYDEESTKMGDQSEAIEAEFESMHNEHDELGTAVKIGDEVQAYREDASVPLASEHDRAMEFDLQRKRMNSVDLLQRSESVRLRMEALSGRSRQRPSIRLEVQPATSNPADSVTSIVESEIDATSLASKPLPESGGLLQGASIRGQSKARPGEPSGYDNPDDEHVGESDTAKPSVQEPVFKRPPVSRGSSVKDLVARYSSAAALPIQFGAPSLGAEQTLPNPAPLEKGTSVRDLAARLAQTNVAGGVPIKFGIPPDMIVPGFPTAVREQQPSEIAHSSDDSALENEAHMTRAAIPRGLRREPSRRASNFAETLADSLL